MTSLKLILLISGLIANVFAQGSDNGFPPEPNRSSIPPQPTSPSPNSTTSAPTTKPTPTTKATTTSRTTTSTPLPPSPNTTTTSTTAKPTTAPTPTPAPIGPKVANWTVNYPNSNDSCIILFVAAQFEVIEKSNKSVTINVPEDATATGTCEGKSIQTMVVTWGQNNSLELDFEKTNSSKFDIKSVISTLNISSETGSTVYKLFHEKPEFAAPLQNSYKCNREQTLNFTEENGNLTVGYLRLSHLQYQAFLNSSEHKFDSALDCDAYVTPDVVPIVVGCVLAALVVAVLAAYLFGRRRCQARGYLSMFEETRREADYIPMKNLSCFN